MLTYTPFSIISAISLEPIRILSNFLHLLKAWENLDQVVIGLGFASHWLKSWREIFKLINKCSNCVIALDSHLIIISYCKSAWQPTMALQLSQGLRLF